MSMPSPIKAPMIDSSTQEFWDAARRGVLRIKRCADCGAYHYYPRPFCPKYLATFRDRVPYVVAIVELDEGPRMETNVVGCPLDELRVGMRLAVVFEDEGEIVLPRFRPA
ncbi:MAG: hypothetical protein E6G39_01360 [Actinobacteria bacterium]|nr:MAG: hypothetical protein E6G39_01360 [Actinomycetota bacterium]